MFVRPSKWLALMMVLLLMGFSVAPVWAFCAAPCCKAAPSVPEPVQSVACHGDQANEPVESTPPCLLKAHQPSDLAARGLTPELRANRLLVAHGALAPVLILAATRVVETNAPGTGPPILHPLRPIYLLSLSLLC